MFTLKNKNIGSRNLHKQLDIILSSIVHLTLIMFTQLSYSHCDFVESTFLLRKLYIQPSLDDKRRFAKMIAGWLGEMACQQKDFQPIIPDSQGEVSSNKLYIYMYL